MKFFECSHGQDVDALGKRIKDLERQQTKLEMEQDWLRNRVLKRFPIKKLDESDEDAKNDRYNGALIPER